MAPIILFIKSKFLSSPPPPPLLLHMQLTTDISKGPRSAVVDLHQLLEGSQELKPEAVARSHASLRDPSEVTEEEGVTLVCASPQKDALKGGICPLPIISANRRENTKQPDTLKTMGSRLFLSRAVWVLS